MSNEEIAERHGFELVAKLHRNDKIRGYILDAGLVLGC